MWHKKVHFRHCADGARLDTYAARSLFGSLVSGCEGACAFCGTTRYESRAGMTESMICYYMGS